jgi:hypothetical protein
MRRSLYALLLLGAAICSSGCGASSSVIGGTTGGTNVTVNITNAFTNGIQAGDAAVTLNAVVTNDKSNAGVTWSLSVANTGCSPGCGTLVASGSPSLSAVYTPPAVSPLNQNATITATSVADPRQSFAFNFSIIPLTSVAITNKFSSTIAGGAAVTVNATVSNDPTNGGVSWTLTAGGTDCAPTCGTLLAAASPSFSALYTPPATIPTGANANPTITATSVNRAAANDSFSFTIANPSTLLKGNYAFLLRGYDGASGVAMVMAGNIVADGNGNITGGEVDFDNGGGVNFVSPPATGIYTVDTSFNGITRGSFEITSFHFPSSTIDLRFRFALSADGSHGRIIELDGSGYLNSGTIQLQDSTALASKPSGNFAFALDSDAPPAGRTVSAGQLVFDSTGITGGLIDESKAADPAPRYSAAAISAAAVSAPDSNGRGTLSINVGSNTTQYAYYVVNTNLVNLIQIDAGLQFGTVQAGIARKQNALTADSVNATSIIQLTGMDEPTGTSTVGTVVTIGQLIITGGNAFNLIFDTNDLGAVLTSHFTNGSIASFDPATGRAVVSAPGDFAAGFVSSAVIYYYDQGAGFFIDTDISTPNGTPPDQTVTNNAFSGTLTPQAAGPFSASNLSGNLIAGFGASSASNIPNWDLGFNLDPSTGSYTATGELTSLPSQDGEATGAQFSGTYGLLNTSLGHGTMTLPAAVFGDFTSGNTVTASFYLIAPNQFVLIGVTSGQNSGVAFFDPQ